MNLNKNEGSRIFYHLFFIVDFHFVPILSQWDKMIFNLFERNLLLFCESGSEFRFKPHNGYRRSAFVCAFLLYSALFFERMSVLMQS